MKIKRVPRLGHECQTNFYMLGGDRFRPQRRKPGGALLPPLPLNKFTQCSFRFSNRQYSRTPDPQGDIKTEMPAIMLVPVLKRVELDPAKSNGTNRAPAVFGWF